MTAVDDLIAFLRARLDDDEQTARAAHQPNWLTDGRRGLRYGLDDEWMTDALTTADADHIARHDPARVLAEVDAKRQIVTAYEEAATEFKDIGPGMVSYDRMVGSVSSLRTAIECLSLAYADHPDYQDMWRP
jgi:hypothetical protein